VNDDERNESDQTSLGPVARAQSAVAALRSLHSGAELSASARAELLSWPGWGALAPAFAAAPTGAWAGIADDLDSILDEDAFAAARDQVDTSFFSPRYVIDAVFDLLRAAGFTGGNVLEPDGC
jgi:hypothetical protein